MKGLSGRTRWESKKVAAFQYFHFSGYQICNLNSVSKQNQYTFILYSHIADKDEIKKYRILTMIYSLFDNELKNNMYKGLYEGKSFQELYTDLIKYHNTGGEANKATIILTALRAVFMDEKQDDILLELLDISTGWCAPHNKIWK